MKTLLMVCLLLAALCTLTACADTRTPSAVVDAFYHWHQRVFNMKYRAPATDPGPFSELASQQGNLSPTLYARLQKLNHLAVTDPDHYMVDTDLFGKGNGGFNAYKITAEHVHGPTADVDFKIDAGIRPGSWLPDRCKALLKQYPDGWRIEDIQIGSERLTQELNEYHL